MSDPNSRVLLPTTGLGAEIREILETALGIPPQSKWFEVRFAMGEPVSYTGEFYAQSPADTPDDDAQETRPPALGGSLDDH